MSDDEGEQSQPPMEMLERSEISTSVDGDNAAGDAVDIFQAARDGLSFHLDKLIEKVAKKHSHNRKGATHDVDKEGFGPLHYAARYGNLDCCERLVKAGWKGDFKGDEDLTPLHLAARYGRCTVVKLFMDHHVDPNVSDIFGQTPLHVAARRGALDVVELLLSQPGIHVNQPDKARITPLHVACSYGYETVAAKFIEKGADVLAKDCDDTTPFLYAIIESRDEVANLLINHTTSEIARKNMISACDYEGNTALHFAAANGDLPLVQLILQGGLSPRARMRDGDTALHLAAANGHANVCVALVDHDPNVLIERNNENRLALHLACETNRIECVTFFQQRMRKSQFNSRDLNGSTPLILAAMGDHQMLFRILLENDANPLLSDEQEQTPLHHACRMGFIEIVKLAYELLSPAKAAMLCEKTDRRDRNPLHIAAQYGFGEICTFLSLKGADPHAKDDEELRPLHLACVNGHLGAVEALVTLSGHKGTLIDDEDENGRTPIHHCAEKGHNDVLELLIKTGANIRARDDKRWTALDYAAEEGHTECAKTLVQHNAEIEAADKLRTTPLHLAARRNHVGVGRLLLDLGADPGTTDVDGHNPLENAIYEGSEAFARMMIEHESWRRALDNPHVNGSTPFTMMIKRMPTVALQVLDRCVSFSDYLQSKRVVVTLLFKYLETDPDDEELFRMRRKGIQKIRTPHDTIESIEKHPLELMHKYKRADLLQHPVTRALIQTKWDGFGKPLHMINLSLYTLFLFMFTYYIAVTPVLANPLSDNSFREPAQFITVAFVAVRLVMELFQIAMQRLNYLDWENSMEILIFTFTLIFFLPFNEIKSQTQWNFAAIAILLAWANAIIFMRRLGVLGVYALMLVEVLKTFLRFSIIFILALVSFAMSFFVLLQNQEGFNTIGNSLAKTLVMMFGEFNYADIFFNPTDPPRDSLTAYIVFVLFVLMMSLILINLLIGLAVGDISQIRADAEIERISTTVALIAQIDNKIPSFLRKRIYQESAKYTPNLPVSLYTRLEVALGLAWKLRVADIEYLDKPRQAEANKAENKQVKMLKKRIDELQTDLEFIRNQNKAQTELLLSISHKVGAGDRAEAVIRRMRTRR